MIFNIEKFKEGELEEFRKEISLEEPIDYQCFFVTARDGQGKLSGLCGFNLDMDKYPRFEHILINPRYQGSRLLIFLAVEMEALLQKRGDKAYVSYILNTNEKMKAYARKWGMKTFQSDDYGEWFFKPLRTAENVQLQLQP